MFKVQNGHYQIVLHYYLPKFPDQHCLTLRGKAEILSVMCCNGIKVIFSLTRQLLQNLSVPHNLLQCKCETDACSGCFRPRQGAQTPSFVQPPTIFCKDNTKSDFFELPNFRKVGKFAASTECPKTTTASDSGGLCPLDPSPGALLLDPAGSSAPRLHYRLALPRSPWAQAPKY